MLLRARRRCRLVRSPDVNWLSCTRSSKRKSPYHTPGQALFREFPPTVSVPPRQSRDDFFPFGYGQNLLLLSQKKKKKKAYVQ